jgi:ribosomal protein S27E
MQLSAAEAEEIGVDPERSWLRESCPNGHDNIVEDHGSSEAACNVCGTRFVYPAGVEEKVVDDTAGEKDGGA